MELTETNQIQQAYNDMYVIISKYIWPFDVVVSLVDVELEAYKKFPDVENLKSLVDKFRITTLGSCPECPDSVEAIDKFREYLDGVSETYAIIKSPQEVSI